MFRNDVNSANEVQGKESGEMNKERLHFFLPGVAV
jgi:hypothetical protein